MNNPKTNIVLHQHIIRTLLYYDIFNYPLKSNEIFRFLGINSLTETDLVLALDKLQEEKVLFHLNDFYSVRSDKEIVDRRIKGNAKAKKYLPIAKRKAKLISRFPFVRAVLASGSLSKDYMDDRSDLDFFVITAPKRLWIARTLLVMYRRLFLFNSHKYFCTNYFVDEDHLEIEEKNLFTATELATVIPLYGSQHYVNLHKANGWLLKIFPNFKIRSISETPLSTTGKFKKFTESLINLMFADKLERYFRNITLKRWKKMYEKNFDEVDFQVAFKSKEYASKNHDKNYQRKVMDLYAEKLRSFDLLRSKGLKEVAE